jgi:hypothetical protein
MSTNEPPQTRKQADEVGAVAQMTESGGRWPLQSMIAEAQGLIVIECEEGGTLWVKPEDYPDAWEQRELYKAQQRRKRRP